MALEGEDPEIVATLRAYPRQPIDRPLLDARVSV
jgi:hypothetical protein